MTDAAVIRPAPLRPADLTEPLHVELDETGASHRAFAFVDVSDIDDGTAQRLVPTLIGSTIPVIGVCDRQPPPPTHPVLAALTCTLVADSDVATTCVRVPSLEQAMDVLASAIAGAPMAAVTLNGLLRLTEHLPVADALVAESLAYSTLLAGPEFAQWLSSHAHRSASATTDPPVLVSRDGKTLRIVLNRPERRNAYSRHMRDALVEALDLATHDESIGLIELSGSGPAFCSGGDLDEFGTTPDVALAHVIRVTRSAGRLLHQLRERTQVAVHGGCVGAGVELAAFAGWVRARPDAWFQLPELSMGLLPGAGGTVSLPRRIGRWRTAWMALTGARIDVDTALQWGLVDARSDA